MLASLVYSKDDQKLDRLRSKMQKNNVDALLLRIPEDVVYVSGYWPFDVSYLVYPLDGEPAIIAYAGEEEYASESWIKDVRPYFWETPKEIGNYLDAASRVIQEVLEDRGLRTNATIGVEASNEFIAANFTRREVWAVGNPTLEYLKRKFPKINLKDFVPELYELRAVKTEKEVNILRVVNEIADLGLRAFLDAISAGKTEAQVAGEVESIVTGQGTGYKGAEKVIVTAFVMSGANTAKAYKMFNIHTTKKLQPGDLVLIELNVCADGYWSDVTRVYPVNQVQEEHRKVIDVVIEAQQASLQQIRDGASAAEVNDAAFVVLEKRGYSNYIRHRVGHGIGCALHEPIPALHSASHHKLQKNMIHSVEPGVYIPGKFGVRVEDMILDLDNKGEYLTNFTRVVT